MHIQAIPAQKFAKDS